MTTARLTLSRSFGAYLATMSWPYANLPDPRSITAPSVKFLSTESKTPASVFEILTAPVTRSASVWPSSTPRQRQPDAAPTRNLQSAVNIPIASTIPTTLNHKLGAGRFGTSVENVPSFVHPDDLSRQGHFSAPPLSTASPNGPPLFHCSLIAKSYDTRREKEKRRRRQVEQHLSIH